MSPAPPSRTLRLKRDVGTSGYVGAMLTDRRDQQDAETDAGVDFSLWPTRRLNVTGFAAFTSAYRDREADKAYRLGAQYQDDRVFAQAQHLLVGPDAETGMGFVTRTDIRRTDGFGEYTFRPRALGLRQIDVFGGGSWITRVTGEEQDGEGFAGCRSSGTAVKGEHLLRGGLHPARRGVRPRRPHPRPPGPLRFATAHGVRRHQPVPAGRASGWRATSPTSGAGACSLLDLGSRISLGKHLTTGVGWTVSQADLPGGSFTAHVVGLRASWAFSTRLVTRAYVQYNSLDRKWITNLRLRFIHRPGSDLYVVFNDEQGEEYAPGLLVNRGFAVKGTWLVRF